MMILSHQARQVLIVSRVLGDTIVDALDTAMIATITDCLLTACTLCLTDISFSDVVLHDHPSPQHNATSDELSSTSEATLYRLSLIILGFFTGYTLMHLLRNEDLKHM
ncbi:hypothetical protein R6Q59_000513 [Mikania micrantha]